MFKENVKYIKRIEKVVSIVKREDIKRYEKENKIKVCDLNEKDYMIFVNSCKEKKKLFMYC